MEIISKNERNNNERTVCSLKEIEKRKIVEHNDLITSVAKMDKVPLKIFELAVSCIDTENLPKDNIIYLSKAELFTFFHDPVNRPHQQQHNQGYECYVQCLNRQNKYQQGTKEKQHIGQLKIIDH